MLAFVKPGGRILVFDSSVKVGMEEGLKSRWVFFCSFEK